jgi:hypothetical protein
MSALAHIRDLEKKISDKRSELPEFSSGWPKYQVMKQSVKLYSASD